MQDVIQMQVDVIVQLLYLDVMLDTILIQEILVLHVLLELQLVPQLHQSNHVELDISEQPLVLHVELILYHVQMQVPL